jgi:hypothetical protein
MFFIAGIAACNHAKIAISYSISNMFTGYLTNKCFQNKDN